MHSPGLDFMSDIHEEMFFELLQSALHDFMRRLPWTSRALDVLCFSIHNKSTFAGSFCHCSSKYVGVHLNVLLWIYSCEVVLVSLLLFLWVCGWCGVGCGGRCCFFTLSRPHQSVMAAMRVVLPIAATSGIVSTYEGTTTTEYNCQTLHLDAYTMSLQWIECRSVIWKLSCMRYCSIPQKHRA